MKTKFTRQLTIGILPIKKQFVKREKDWPYRCAFLAIVCIGSNVPLPNIGYVEVGNHLTVSILPWGERAGLESEVN